VSVMIVAAAVLSVIVFAGPADAQQSTPPAAPQAYTLSGVRRATSPSPSPSPDASAQAPASPSAPDGQAAAPEPAIKKVPSGRELVVDTQVKGDKVPLPRDNGLVTTSMGPMGSGWHDEYLAMTQSRPGTGPYDGFVNSADRALGIATSMAFALAIQQAASLVEHAAGAYKEWKLNKVKSEVDGERQIVEQLFQASQGGKK
jgi:hypothetical protein